MLFFSFIPVFCSSFCSVNIFFVVMSEPSVALMVMYGENCSGMFHIESSCGFSLFRLFGFGTFLFGEFGDCCGDCCGGCDCCVSLKYFVYFMCCVCCVCVPGFWRSGVLGVGKSPGFLGEEVGVDPGDSAGKSLWMASTAIFSISGVAITLPLPTREAFFLPFPSLVVSEVILIEVIVEFCLFRF